MVAFVSPASYRRQASVAELALVPVLVPAKAEVLAEAFRQTARELDRFQLDAYARRGPDRSEPDAAAHCTCLGAVPDQPCEERLS